MDITLILFQLYFKGNINSPATATLSYLMWSCKPAQITLVKCLCSTPSYFSGGMYESYIHPHTKRHHLTAHLILREKLYGTQAPQAVPQHKKQSVQLLVPARKEGIQDSKATEIMRKGSERWHDLRSEWRKTREDQEDMQKLNFVHMYLNLIYQAVYTHVHST